MSESPPVERTGPAAVGGGGNVSDIDQAALRRLTEASTAEEFCGLWLDLQSRMIGGVTGGIVVYEKTEGEPFAPVAVWPRGERDRTGLVAVIERVVKERKGVVLRSDTLREAASPDEVRQLIAYPVLSGSKLHAVAALELTPRVQLHLLAAMRQLQWGVAWLQNWVLRQTAWPEAHLKLRLTTALEMTALVLQEKRYRQAATAFLTDLASRLNCDRISFGLLRGKQVKIQAISHSSDFKRQMNLIRSIGSAMSESLDQQSILIYPEGSEDGGQVLRAHDELARSHGDRSICTVPFVNHEGRFIGAITLERSSPEPFDRDTAHLCDGVTAVVGPLLEEKRRGDRPFPVAAWESLRDFSIKLFGPGHITLKLVASGLLALLLFMSLASGTYRVTAATTLEGEIRRVVASPYRGFVAEAPVRAGDLVDEGQMLCRLDDRDLRLEHTRLSTEREQYALERRRAMADGDLAAMKVLGNKIGQSEAQMALLEEQMARALIMAPFRGVVVSGDLSQALGAPVETGQVLFEIAPLDAYRLMLKVDEWDISHVRIGQRGNLILTALPETKLPFSVTKITPVTVAEQGRSYFKVEARLDEASDRLRPGMEGFAKVEIDRRRLIWIWTHDLIDWLRLKIWSWWP